MKNKEDVLKIKYEKKNKNITLGTIVYQNENVLKRGIFNDEKLNIKSSFCPEYTGYGTIMIRGRYYDLDHYVLEIPNNELKYFKKRIKKLNKKYGLPQKWIPLRREMYYHINFNAFEVYATIGEVDKDIEHCNCFKTEKLANEALDKIIKVMRYKNNEAYNIDDNVLKVEVNTAREGE